MRLHVRSLKGLLGRRLVARNTEKLYGAIVAQARLPVFYRAFAVPDTLQGRFAVLALHLFAVLHGLKAKGARARVLAQALADRFAQDMETVMRELGVSDLKVPKAMRSLATSSRSLIEDYETALAAGEIALAAAIAARLPLAPKAAGLSSRRLASYLCRSVERIEAQPLSSLRRGHIQFSAVSSSP